MNDGKSNPSRLARGVLRVPPLVGILRQGLATLAKTMH